MRWRGRRESTNVEDRRSASSGGGLMLGGKSKIVMLIIVVVAGYYGVDLSGLLSGGMGPSSVTSPQSAPYQPTAEEQEMASFTSVTLGLTEDTWAEIFKNQGETYVPPKLVLYSGSTRTNCGYGQSAMGPFYCPADQTVYIDLSFYQDMKNKLGGGGDFAQGYVIAHEVGHHIQHLLGTDQKVRQLQSGATQAQANQLSVKMELQADCYAGVWGSAMQKQGILEVGDVEEALKTAEAIGDDRLQRQGGGQVVPDSFTHGSSEQRYRWFKRGFDSGDPKVCDTFAAG